MNEFRINPFRSERFVITCNVNNKKYKIFQIIFGSDGSLFVNFPYYLNSEGLVSLVKYPKNIEQPTDLNLEPGGRVTSHLVKYTHHLDGEAHFSQDGLVKTEIRKKSIPLHGVNGHIFTTQLQGLKNFKSTNIRESSSIKRMILTFNLGDSEPDAIKIVGRIYSSEQVINRFRSKFPVSEIGPIAPMIVRGKQYSAPFLSPPIHNPSDNYILTLTCEKVPKLDKQESTTLTFIGGFDSHDLINNLSADTTFLALCYPISNYEECKKQIGCIDLLRNGNIQVINPI
jgi:hypothetical protein